MVHGPHIMALPTGLLCAYLEDPAAPTPVPSLAAPGRFLFGADDAAQAAGRGLLKDTHEDMPYHFVLAALIGFQGVKASSQDQDQSFRIESWHRIPGTAS